MRAHFQINGGRKEELTDRSSASGTEEHFIVYTTPTTRQLDSAYGLVSVIVKDISRRTEDTILPHVTDVFVFC